MTTISALTLANVQEVGTAAKAEYNEAVKALKADYDKAVLENREKRENNDTEYADIVNAYHTACDALLRHYKQQVRDGIGDPKLSVTFNESDEYGDF